MHEDSPLSKIFVNIADFSCVTFWAQNDLITILHTILWYCTRRGLINKSNHGGGKEKSLSYLRGLINHMLEQTNSDK